MKIDARFVRKHGWFIWLVAVPTFIAAVYYLLIASDRYVSEARFVVKSEGQHAPQVSSLASLISSSGMSAGQEQTNEVVDYIHSRNALADIASCTDIRAQYGARGADLFSRYPSFMGENTLENLYRYYGDMVNIKVDANSTLAVLSTQAFTPKDARQINLCLLNRSEALVNRLNEKARTNAISEAEQQVELAQQRVKKARIALAAYRNRSDLLDPKAQAAGVFDVTTKLTGEQASLQAQLDLMKRVAPANPAIPGLESRISALAAQIAAQSGRAVGSDTAISSKLTNYEALNLEQEFASSMLNISQTQLAQAHAEAARQQFYIERVVEPNLPDMATQPHRLVKVITIGAALLSLYLVAWMFIVGILEHSPED